MLPPFPIDVCHSVDYTIPIKDSVTFHVSSEEEMFGLGIWLKWIHKRKEEGYSFPYENGIAVSDKDGVAFFVIRYPIVDVESLTHRLPWDDVKELVERFSKLTFSKGWKVPGYDDTDSNDVVLNVSGMGPDELQVDDNMFYRAFPIGVQIIDKIASVINDSLPKDERNVNS